MIESVKDAQIETNSKVKLTNWLKNMWQIHNFKPPTDISPTAERPDNRMKKRLMTKPRRGRAKEHGAIPANDHIKSTISWLHQVGISKKKMNLQSFLKTLNL